MGNCTHCIHQEQQQQQQQSQPTANITSPYDSLSRSFRRNLISNRFRNIRTFQPYNLNALIDETLSIIRTVVDTDQEPPHAMIVVSRIANREDRWLDVMIALIERIPIHDPLGATVIALLLDECSLPSKELVQQLIKRVCSDNHSRIVLLQSIIDGYIKENQQKTTIDLTNGMSVNKTDVNETTSMVAKQSNGSFDNLESEK